MKLSLYSLMYFSNMSSAVYTLSLSSLNPFRNFSEQKSVGNVSFCPEITWFENLTGKVGVIELHVAAACVIEDLQFGLVRFCDVAKVFFVGAVYGFGISLALDVSQVVPVRRGKSDLQVLDFVFRDLASEVLELVDIGASNVLDLASANHGLAGLVTSFQEGRNVGGIFTEDVDLEIGDLFESFQTRKESSPEHC